MMQFCKINISKSAVMTASCLIGFGLMGTSAQADDFNKEGIRGDSYCFPAKYAAKTIRAISKVSPERKDVVAVNMKPQFLIYDNGSLPDKYYIVDQDQTIDLTINSDGQVPDFIEKVSQADAGAELCIDDPARAGLSNDDESLYFEMGLTPFYKNRSGRHDMAELAEGTKDGKSQYKKMIPAAARLFMPDTRCLHIKYDKQDTPPQILASVGGQLLPIETEYYNEGYVLHFDDLIKMDAEALIIQGGSYKLSPVPSVKTMKRFGIGLPRGAKAKTPEAL